MYYCSSVIGLGSRWSALQMAFFDACLSMCLCVAFSAIFSLARVDQSLIFFLFFRVCVGNYQEFCCNFLHLIFFKVQLSHAASSLGQCVLLSR
ncbi:Toxin subunit [Trichinella pseudospiralis]